MSSNIRFITNIFLFSRCFPFRLRAYGNECALNFELEILIDSLPYPVRTHDLWIRSRGVLGRDAQPRHAARRRS